MSEITDKSLTVVEFFQKWMSTRNPLEIGTQFSIEGQNKTITLVECDGYEKGKFVDDNGEDFDITKNPELKFIQIVKNKDGKETSYYDEDVWNAFDIARNGTKVIKDEKKPLILKGLGEEQRNELFHDIEYYDVTEIIEKLINFKKYGIKKLKVNEIVFTKILNIYNYPVLTKEKLRMLFFNCNFVKTQSDDVMRIEKNGEVVGYTLEENGRFLFVPKNKTSNTEYSYEENQALGFYYTADSYLDIALESIRDYNEKFMILHHNDPSKNKDDPGYQASSTIKTLLAFSCECYLKSLLINNGVKMNELKDLGHSLVNLFSSLNDNLSAKVFDFMQRRGYSIESSLKDPIFEANDLTEKFMLDLARNDNAFEDSRYSAEFEKNTNYTFLYNLALALRNCSNKEYMTFSPFTEFIEKNISKNHR